MNSRRLYLIQFLALLMALASTCLAQSASANKQDTTRKNSPSDTVMVSASPQIVTHDTSRFTMTKSPTAAILYSIIPGGGQIYNQQYWKAPIFFGVAAFFVARVIYYHKLFLDTAAALDALPANDSRRSQLRYQREFYRDNRDLNAAYFLGVEILNMIDAYVGAHLFDFDVGEDVSSHLYLDPRRQAIGFDLRW